MEPVCIRSEMSAPISTLVWRFLCCGYCFAFFITQHLKKTVLLRFNSRTTQSTHLKCTIQCGLVYSQVCTHHYGQF